MSQALALKDLTVQLDRAGGAVALAEGITLDVAEGETLCVVGESGSGKSVTMLSVARLLEFTAPIRIAGQAEIDGEDVLGLTQAQMARLRSQSIGFVFQEAMEALNPTRSVGAQLEQAYLLAKGLRRPGRAQRADARARAIALLDEVGLDRPEVVHGRFPHQLSGGMQQRVVIALALIGEPRILIADEPTTALDVTIQDEILQLLLRVQRERQMACILITHDMGVAATVADRIAVMYAGQVVEVGQAERMLTAPMHPYTKALLECVPRPGQRMSRLRTIPGSVPAPGEAGLGDRFAPRNRLASERDLTEAPPLKAVDATGHLVRAWEPVEEWTPEMVAALSGDFGDAPARPAPSRDILVSLRGVTKTYWAGRAKPIQPGATSLPHGATRAVEGVDLDIYRGELFGVVGETGSGKSTLGRMLLDLERADEGSEIDVAGYRLEEHRGLRAERELRRRVQMIFQNPQDTLDPRLTIRHAIAEPLQALTDLDRPAIEARVLEMLDAVGLSKATADKHPSEISGGQRQRVAIARAIAPRPQLIVADEPTSALDVSVQGQIVNLMLDLQREMGLSYVFITHNLSLITSIADRVGVMYKSHLVEVSDAAELVRAPKHEYTQRLLASNPSALPAAS